MSILACDRIDINQGKPLHWAAAMGHLKVVKELLKSKKEVDINVVKYLPLRDEDHKCRNPNLAKCGGEAQHLEK
jgi:ankyrin repeat protein